MGFLRRIFGKKKKEGPTKEQIIVNSLIGHYIDNHCEEVIDGTKQDLTVIDHLRELEHKLNKVFSNTDPIKSVGMTTDRIKEIQEETAYPQSRSVQQALLKVWNETQQGQLNRPEIRNKLSPISNLIAMVEEIPDPEFLFTEVFLDELEKAKRAVEILSNE